MKERIRLVPLGDPDQFEHFRLNAERITLREFLQHAPALSVDPLEQRLMDLDVSRILISPWESAPATPLYRPPGMVVGVTIPAPTPAPSTTVSELPRSDAAQTQPALPKDDLPATIEEREAVQVAYGREIDSTAGFLRAGLSVLVVCEKLLVEHLWRAMVARTGKLRPRLLEVVEEEGGLMPRGLRQRQLAQLKALIRDLKDGDVLVIPHLDLIGGGSENNLPTESRELIELAYEAGSHASSRLMLAFTDPSLDLPEVLSARFAVRLAITGVPQRVMVKDKERELGEVLVTTEEAAHFVGFEPGGLYKNVAGMNAIRLRHAIRYAVQEYAGSKQVPVHRLYEAIRAFKAQTSIKFEVPNVKFGDIGGYAEVKAELLQAIGLMRGAMALPNEELRRELIPRGFLFYGPPGTGKTLFAKAIASSLEATIQIVSGPEVTDMYVGESERKLRELFAEARRNAPAVLVFDEFDSIAARRSGREDGGSRAGNAIVAQILTEMDGFRPDVPMLVIGTTNRLDIIDDALLRPSRFRPIGIDLPDETARLAIARVHAKHFGIDVSEELLRLIAATTNQLNGDEIRSLFRDACVGLHCQDPPLPPDARRLGDLVGQIRQAHEKREADRAGQRGSRLQTRRHADDRPRPPAGMTQIPDAGANQ